MISIKKQMNEALLQAASDGKNSRIEELLRWKANVNAKTIFDDTPLHNASRYNRTTTIRTLIKAGAKIDAVDHAGRTPLFFTAMYGNIAAARILIKAGANVNSVTTSGCNSTALSCAIQNNYPEITNLLRENGAK